MDKEHKDITPLAEPLILAYQQREEAKRVFEQYDLMLSAFAEIHGIGARFQDEKTGEVYEIVDQKWKSVKMQTVALKKLSKKAAVSGGFVI